MAVEMELKQVESGFRVSLHKSLNSDETKALGSTEFVVYLVSKNDINKAMKHTKAHLSIARNQEEKTRKDLEDQFKKEGGATVRLDKKSVQFVVVEKYEQLLPSGPSSGDTKMQKHAGEQMAEMILHELGHGMGAEHKDGGLMKENLDISTDVDVPKKHYTEASRKKMRTRLSALGMESP